MRASQHYFHPGPLTKPVERFIITTSALATTWFYAGRKSGRIVWSERRQDAQEFFAHEDACRSTAVRPGFSEVVAA